jgi:hypothetical protein
MAGMACARQLADARRHQGRVRTCDKAFDRLFKVIVARDDQAKRAEGMVVQQTSLIGVLLLFAVRVNFDLCQ